MCLAIPGKVEEILTEGDLRIGRVNFGGVVKRVCLDYVPEVEVGDYTIVHVGFALSKIDQESAEKTLAVFEQMGMLEEELASEEEHFARAAAAPQSPVRMEVARLSQLAGKRAKAPLRFEFCRPWAERRTGETGHRVWLARFSIPEFQASR